MIRFNFFIMIMEYDKGNIMNEKKVGGVLKWTQQTLLCIPLNL